MATKTNWRIVAVKIPRENLKNFKDYVGYLFLNENGVYNVCKTEEDIIKTNTWFKNFPLDVYVVSSEKVQKGEKLFGNAVNRDLNQKIFEYLGPNEEGVDIHDFRDEEGNTVISTTSFLAGSPKFLHRATESEKRTIVNRQSLDIFTKREKY